MLKIEKNTGKTWTEEEKQFLIDTITTLSVREQAEKLGRTSRAIMGMRNKLGLRVREKVWTDEKIQMLIDFHNNGVGYEDMAEVLKIHPRTIRDKAVEIGLVTFDHLIPPKKDDIHKQVMDKLEIGTEYLLTESYGYGWGTEFLPDHNKKNGCRLNKAKLIDYTDEFLIFDNGSYKECVSYTDIHCKKYIIEEVE